MTTRRARADDAEPSFLASVGGYLRPGHDTAREGAAGSALTVVASLLAVSVAVGYVLVRRSRR